MTELGKTPITGRLTMNTPGPSHSDDRWRDDPPAFSMSFDRAAAETMIVAVRAALLASEAGDWRPLVRLVEMREDAMAISIVAEALDDWRRRGVDSVLRLFNGGRREGRPIGSYTNAMLIFYVAAVKKRHKLPSDEAAMRWMSENPREFPVRYSSFEALKASFQRAKRDLRLKPMLLWDISREALFSSSPAAQTRRSR